MKRLAATLLTGVFLMAAWIPAASAGGWAAISFDEVPAGLEAGTTHTLGFTVLGHGVRPVDVGNDVEIRFIGQPGTETFAATPSGGTGHYTVDVTLPEAGEWRWEVDTNVYPVQRLGTISVVDAPATPVDAGGSMLPVLRTVLPLATLATLAVALVLLRRSGGMTGPAAAH